MRLTLGASALASILMLYSNNVFSMDALNLGHGERGEQSRIDEKNLYKHKLNTGDYIGHNYMSRVGRALVSGQAISYMWSSNKSVVNNNTARAPLPHQDNCGITYDAMLRVGAELKSADSGIKYGADFQVAVPSVKGINFERKAALNRGSRIFAVTPYGDFSVGYQEGVESLMRLDASNVAAGDESSGWTHHIRGVLPENKNAFGYEMYPFLLSPGLYSENVFRNNDNAVLDSSGVKDFVNNLPLRMSYQSPSFMGLRFGVSYSPFGYKFDLFDKNFSVERAYIRYVNLPEDRQGQVVSVPVVQLRSVGDSIYNVFFGSKYEHILSGGVAFDYNYSSVRFSTSVVGEYAHPRSRFNIRGRHYYLYPDSYNLQGLSVGSVVNYNNVSLAAGYGYLGKSGFVKRYHNYVKVYPVCERSTTYYWDAALGYQYKSYYFSLAYFKSVRSENVLQDVSLGLEYSLLRGRSKIQFKLFGNYHHYKFSEIAIREDRVNYRGSVDMRDIVDGISNGGSNAEIVVHPGNMLRSYSSAYKRKLEGAGNVLLVGVKLEF
ncbi:MAG: hypothetical protein ACTJLM_00295 [Ehrlichia sp.]